MLCGKQTSSLEEKVGVNYDTNQTALFKNTMWWVFSHFFDTGYKPRISGQIYVDVKNGNKPYMVLTDIGQIGASIKIIYLNERDVTNRFLESVSNDEKRILFERKEIFSERLKLVKRSREEGADRSNYKERKRELKKELRLNRSSLTKLYFNQLKGEIETVSLFQHLNDPRYNFEIVEENKEKLGAGQIVDQELAKRAYSLIKMLKE